MTALAVENSGARLISGSYDYMVRFWDFGGVQSFQYRTHTRARPSPSRTVRAQA